MRQRVVSFPGPAGVFVLLELADLLAQFRQGHPEPTGALVKVVTSFHVGAGIGSKRKVVGKVSSLAIEPRTLRGYCYTIR
jgi:hypothetical protein